MECNKEEGRRAIGIAESKFSQNDYNGAKKFAKKAHDLYPKLDGLKQFLTMIDVYSSASNQNNGGVEESDWYGILGVDHLADEETLKKQYKKLARLLHPDKNKFSGAEGAFILVSDVWGLLSSDSERIAYDQRRKSKEEDEQKARRDASSSDPLRWFDGLKSRTTSDGAKDPFREWFAAKEAENANSTAEAERIFKKRAHANSTSEAERLFKKPVVNENSTCEAERLFGNWMKRANANCTSEAERLFKKPMRQYV